MKRILDKIATYITDNEQIAAYLFLVIFVTRIFIDLVIEKIFGLGEEWQHYIFAFYKYNYLIVIGYMLIYEIFYLYRFHKFHFTKIQWIGILYAFVAIIATYAYLKDQLSYDYFTKLSLGEMIMTSVFMFDVGRKLSPNSFKKLLEICAKYYLVLIFFINILSLAILILNVRENFTLLGRTITIPYHIEPPASLLGSYPYAGFYYNTSITGPCCCLSIFLLIWLFKEKKPNKYVLIVFSTISFYCLFLSANRTSVLELFVFLLLVLIIRTKNKSGRKMYLLYLSVVLMLFTFFSYILFRKMNFSYLKDILLTDPFEAIDSLSARRLRIFLSVINIFKNRPFLGNGWNSIIPVESAGIHYDYPYAHNIFLGALSWTGGIGFIIFTLYFYMLIKKALNVIKNKPKYCLYSCISLSIIVQCQFENGILGDWNHAYTYLFWLLIGFISSIA